MKTATLGTNPNCPKSPALGAAEQEAICGVIQRAEQLDVHEKERVRFFRGFYRKLYNAKFTYFHIFQLSTEQV